MAKRVKDTSSLEEALRLSSIQAPALTLDRQVQTYSDDDEDEDQDLADLNNPDVEALADPPVLGARPRASDMFGQEAETFGRATSPKLYAQAAQFPTAVQFRVWRWENGIPVALGAIDAEATEEDLVRSFVDAMPKKGEGRFQFRLRPIDIRGQELGKEFTINISEHHVTLKQLRDMKDREKERDMEYNPGYRNSGGDIIVNSPPPAPIMNDAGASYAEEMGRMFEQAVESAERRTEVLQSTLETERERLREEENRRAQERVSMAERSADVVQKMTEKLMASDRLRSDEAMKAQRDHGQLLLSTLTTVFQQQQEASRQQTERMREVDMARMSQDREFFDRQRQEMETRRIQERDEEERRRLREKEDWERRREEDRHRLELEAKRIEDQRRYELEQIRIEAQRREQEIERRRDIEKEDMRVRLERDRAEQDRREKEQERLRLLERDEMERRRMAEREEFERRRESEKEELRLRAEQIRADLERKEREFERTRETEKDSTRLWLERERQEVDRRERENERRREMEREEIRLKMEREKLEAERLRQQMIEERERWRVEIDERRRAEQMEWERKQAAEKDERDRRERNERERWEREKLEITQRIERERIEADRKESLRREELAREEARRRDEMQMTQQQLQLAAQRDREHAERMMEMARLEREAQREAQAQREKADREAREAADRDRQRQHELQIKEMEMSKERDREHAERMISLTKAQNSGGLSGITDLLGMETPEVLARIFGTGADGEEKSTWSDVIPKVIGSLAEVGKAVAATQAAAATTQAAQVSRTAAATAAGAGQQVAIQTPEGIKLIPASVLAQMQAQQRREMVRAQRQQQAEDAVIDMDLPDEGMLPARPDEEEEEEEAPTATQAAEEAPADPRSAAYIAGEAVDTMKRARAAKMPLPKQRAARKAIRELGERLTKADESDWLGIVTEAITSEFAIYNYIKAVTVYAALAEAKIEPTLAERIVNALRESGMIPDDVPFSEEDFNRLAEKAGE